MAAAEIATPTLGEQLPAALSSFNPLAEHPPSTAAASRADLYTCTGLYCAAWARGCGRSGRPTDELMMARALEHVDCSHVRAQLDCDRAMTLYAAALRRRNGSGNVLTSQRLAQLLLTAAPDERGLGRRSEVCLAASCGFEVLYLTYLSGGSTGQLQIELDMPQRQVLLAREAGRRLLLPRVRTDVCRMRARTLNHRSAPSSASHKIEPVWTASRYPNPACAVLWIASRYPGLRLEPSLAG